MLGFKDDKILGWNIGLALGAKNESFDDTMLTEGTIKSALGELDRKFNWMVFVDGN